MTFLPSFKIGKQMPSLRNEIKHCFSECTNIKRQLLKYKRYDKTKDGQDMPKRFHSAALSFTFPSYYTSLACPIVVVDATVTNVGATPYDVQASFAQLVKHQELQFQYLYIDIPWRHKRLLRIGLRDMHLWQKRTSEGYLELLISTHSSAEVSAKQAYLSEAVLRDEERRTKENTEFHNAELTMKKLSPVALLALLQTFAFDSTQNSAAKVLKTQLEPHRAELELMADVFSHVDLWFTHAHKSGEGHRQRV
eukprot:5438939-Amphidinium_carterae.1